jgi:hypothetical protein
MLSRARRAVPGSTGALELHTVGDCVAPRLAVMAIYEGRELALRL